MPFDTQRQFKSSSTEAVAEALLDIYSRVGIHEEVLTDQGTQFMSECMQEVSRLVTIRVLPVRRTIPFAMDCCEIQKPCKKHYDKDNPRRLEMGVFILLPTDSNKLRMQWRGPNIVKSSCGSQRIQSEDGVSWIFKRFFMSFSL